MIDIPLPDNLMSIYCGGDIAPLSGTSSSFAKPQNSTIAPLTSPSS